MVINKDEFLGHALLLSVAGIKARNNETYTVPLPSSDQVAKSYFQLATLLFVNEDKPQVKDAIAHIGREVGELNLDTPPHLGINNNRTLLLWVFFRFALDMEEQHVYVIAKLLKQLKDLYKTGVVMSYEPLKAMALKTEIAGLGQTNVSKN